MKTLLSKTQFKNFEVGEFGQIGQRTLDETLNLINEFPWNTERALASVELHCPSVTIEHPSGTFLKLGPYFGGKFCFYHCSKRGKVTFCIIDELDKVSATVAAFFDGNGNVAGFQLYKYVFNALGIFRTNTYEYKPGSKAAFNYLKLDLLIYVAPTLLMMSQFFTNWTIFLNPYACFTFFCLILLIMGPSFYLMFDYESYNQNLYLRISRGHRNFLFGGLNGICEYDKADISDICRYYNHGSRNPWQGSQVYKLVFKDGTTLIFSSLLITQWAFVKKFPDVTIRSEHIYFPTMAKVLSRLEQQKAEI
jgi:hypothetical protein